jgi:diguanylate cyclase (GGDEF)-like protein/PAS domain S-box-containing protein
VNIAAGDPRTSIDAMVAAAGLPAVSADTGVVVHGRDGETLAASPIAQEILGLTFEQMQGLTLQDPRWAVVDETGQFVELSQAPTIMAARTGLAVRDRIMGVFRPESDAAGQHVWLHVDAVPVAHPSTGGPWAVVAAFRPVRGIQLQGLKLQDSERFFRMVAEHSSDMVAWQLAPDTTFMWVSPAARTVLGFDPDSLIGTRALSLVHPDDLPRLTRPEHSSPAPVPSFTVRMRHAEGHFRWIEITAHTLPVQAGRPQQMITAFRDVTDRVNAELARDSAVRMFELATEHATIGVAWRGLDGRLIRVNPAICTILERPVSELVGRALGDFAADDDAEWGSAVAAVESGSLSHYESEREFYRPDGSVVSCLATLIGLPDESGMITAVLVQLQDISAQKTAIAQLERAAITDPLTGLPNRTVLKDRLTVALARARGSATLVGVLFIDLDHFKSINDTHGHDAGDTLLREVGSRLAAAASHSDTVVRLGGDEFVVVREHLPGDLNQLEDLAQQLCQVFSKPFRLNGRRLTVSASIGGAAGADLTADELLSQADDAMYWAKRTGQSVKIVTRMGLHPAGVPRS